MAGGFGDLKRQDDRHEPAKAERVLMGVSVIVTIVLFSYVGWHAWTAPAGAEPAAQVLGYAPFAEGVLVEVELVNPGGVGLLTVDVSVDCDDPPPTVAFTNVPASGRRMGHVVCPPGTTQANATVASFVAA